MEEKCCSAVWFCCPTQAAMCWSSVRRGRRAALSSDTQSCSHGAFCQPNWQIMSLRPNSFYKKPTYGSAGQGVSGQLSIALPCLAYLMLGPLCVLNNSLCKKGQSNCCEHVDWMTKAPLNWQEFWLSFQSGQGLTARKEGKVSKISFTLDKYQQFVWLSQSLLSAVNTQRKGLWADRWEGVK